MKMARLLYRVYLLKLLLHLPYRQTIIVLIITTILAVIVPANGEGPLTSNAALSIVILGVIRIRLEVVARATLTTDAMMDPRGMVERIVNRLMGIVVPENIALGLVTQNLVVMITVVLVIQKRDKDIDHHCLLIFSCMP